MNLDGYVGLDQAGQGCVVLVALPGLEEAAQVAA
jgi:Iap family predicted aminopeptidase